MGGLSIGVTGSDKLLVGEFAKRQRMASRIEQSHIYRVPFEKFERYTPYGTPTRIADFLGQYVERGARILNIEARGNSPEEAIDAVSEVSEILHSAFPHT